MRPVGGGGGGGEGRGFGGLVVVGSIIGPHAMRLGDVLSIYF